MPPEAVPINASVASTGLGLRYIGNWAYAFSGAIPATIAEQTALEFTTGSGYILADIECNAYLQYTGASVRVGAFKISFNGQIIAQILAPTTGSYAPSTATQRVVIPPFTEVLIETVCTADDADNYASVNIVGTVYGAD